MKDLPLLHLITGGYSWLDIPIPNHFLTKMVLDDFTQQAPAPHPFNASLRRVRRGALGSGRPLVGPLASESGDGPENLHILGKDHKI